MMIVLLSLIMTTSAFAHEDPKTKLVFGKKCTLNNEPVVSSYVWVVEKESDLKLFPTYAYWRYYVFGAILKKHTDRPACEISVTACIKKYDNWPIVIEGTSFELEEGDAVLYAGCDQKHWRSGVYKGEGMAQVFFHYVNKNGIYQNYAYDNK